MPRESLEVRTSGIGLYDITDAVRAAVRASGVHEGILAVFCRHTSASLVIQEAADPTASQDLVRFFLRLVPEGGPYSHTAEGPDDMPSHIRSALTRTSEVIPIAGGDLVLGRWQGLFLFEHRRRPHRRRVELQIIADS